MSGHLAWYRCERGSWSEIRFQPPPGVEDLLPTLVKARCAVAADGSSAAAQGRAPVAAVNLTSHRSSTPCCTTLRVLQQESGLLSEWLWVANPPNACRMWPLCVGPVCRPATALVPVLPLPAAAVLPFSLSEQILSALLRSEAAGAA